jgi:hypothetical protein
VRQILPHKRRALSASMLIIGLTIMMLVTPTMFAAPRSTPGENNNGLAYGQQTRFGKSHLVQDPKWYAAKVARRNRLLGIGSSGPMLAPSSYNLSTSVTGQTFEQLGNAPGGGTTPDASGHLYTDGYFWNFCGEGATTVALGYWNTISPINQMGSFTAPDPHTITTWDDTHNRAYIYWLGMEVKPPSFGSYGEFAYGTYPSGTTYTTDLRDTLNWEASRENTGNWSNYYYGIVWASNLSQSSLMADVESDVGVDHKADVVDVNTAYLPSWAGTGKSLSHYVAITGYNAGNNTLTYIDTCGTGCGSKGNGVYTVSLSSLYNGIENNFGNGSIVW